MLLANPSTLSTRSDSAELRIVAHLYHLRMLGLGLGFFCVASVLFQNHIQPLVWAVLVFGRFVWPHVAYRLALGSQDAFNAEIAALLGQHWSD
jgi:diguanylate cyclase